jgi:hypothetical protein
MLTREVVDPTAPGKDDVTLNEYDGHERLSQHDLIYDSPPLWWQDGLVLGNGSLGAVFYAPEGLEWLINKTDVIDGRVHGVQRVIPRDAADDLVRAGATPADFERAERGAQPPEGIGPKTCCRLTMDLGMATGSGVRTARPAIHSRLALAEATLYVALEKHLCHPRVESYVHAHDDLLVIRVREVSPIVVPATRLFFSRPEDIELPDPRLWAEDGRLFLEMRLPETGRYAAGVAVIPRQSTAYRDGVLQQIRPQYHPPEIGTVQTTVRGRFGLITVEGDFDLYLAVASDRDADDPVAAVREQLARVCTGDQDALQATHRTWWQGFWARSRVSLDDRELEALFYRSLYALGCAYRKAPLPGLLGLCYGPNVGPLQYTPVAGDLHHNLNVQCPFFAVHALNHSELFDAYLDTYQTFLPEARRLAREIWGAPGAHFDMCFNARGRSLMGGVGTYRYFFGGSYVALMHCLCWRYTRDRHRLATKIYPFLKEVLAFYQYMMAKGTDGCYHLYPAHACELNIMETGDPVQVISMLKVCLQTAIEAANLLQVDHELAAGWREFMQQLPAYPRGWDRAGREVVVDGTGIPADHHVGQAGCLHPVYPCGEIDAAAEPSILALYARTLESVVDKTAEISYADETGYHYKCVWQCFFRAMTALRLGRVHEFWSHYLPMFLRTYVKPNGLLSHDACVIVDPASSEANLATIPDDLLLDCGQAMPVFEPWCGHDGGATPDPDAKRLVAPWIEASGDYLTLITECLLQSHHGIIRVFPGWPLERPAAFSDFVAEGDWRVSASCRDGRVEHLVIRRGPNCAGTLRLQSPWTGAVVTYEVPRDEGLTLTPDHAHPPVIGVAK